MSLARIDLAEGETFDHRRTIGEVIYDALVEVLKAPKDRFQLITENPAKDFIFDPYFLGIQRSKDCVFIQVTLNAGEPWIRNVPFTKQSQTDCTSVSACAGKTCSFVRSKSAKRTGRLATVRRNTRNRFTEQETLGDSIRFSHRQSARRSGAGHNNSSSPKRAGDEYVTGNTGRSLRRHA
jgi:Tautomerase enzyme